MLKSLNLFNTKNQNVSVLTKERQFEIENLVNSILKQYGYDNEKDDYVDISDFINKLGFSVGGADLEDNADGFIVVRDKYFKRTDNLGDKFIVVNQNRSFELQRFIIAYEYAYFILEYEKTDYFSHRKVIKEQEAEEPDVLYFARALLIPRFSFERVLKHSRATGTFGNVLIAQLASIYKVSAEDIINRILDIMDLNDSCTQQL